MHRQTNVNFPGLKACSLSFAILALSTFSITSAGQGIEPEKTISQRLSIGSSHSSGSYGNEIETDFSVSSLSYSISSGAWRANILLPYNLLEGPADVVFERGRVRRARLVDFLRDRQGQEEVSGIGDVNVGLSYFFTGDSSNDWQFDLGLQLSIPTANEEEGLGSGEFDAAYQLGFFRPFNGYSLFGNIGYETRGGAERYDLEGGVFFSFGSQMDLGEYSQLGLVYDFQQAVVTGTDSIHELSPYISYYTDSGWQWMLYGVTGFTDSSVDKALGLQLSLDF